MPIYPTNSCLLLLNFYAIKTFVYVLKQCGIFWQDELIFLFCIKELREKFDQEKPPLLLSAALGCRKPDIDNAYEIEKISEYKLKHLSRIEIFMHSF